ncbi:MAG: MBL fold metallo-hydrolase [Clostridia bacterium]|nr:MBL fold metallo-hydrolase [Clostridia bacterium]
MKKTVSFLLCLIMLMGAVASCGTNNTLPGSDTTANDTTVKDTTTAGSIITTQPIDEQVPFDGLEIDVSKCTIIRPKSASPTLMAGIIEMKAAIDTKTGGITNLMSDRTTGEENAYEIVVGDTERAQSSEVKQKLTDNTYIIEKIDNKIVILGSTDAITIEAMKYFVAAYVEPMAADGKLRVPNELKVISEQYQFLDIVKNGRCRYNVIFSDELDTTANANNGKVDYQVQLANNVRDKLAALTGLGVSVRTDFAKPGADTSSTYEILIGETSREESIKARENYAVNEYGVSFIGNKIVVTGWSDRTIGLAVDMFIDMLEGAVVTEADGTKNIKFLSNVSSVKSYSSWVSDVPEFEGGTFAGSSTCNHEDLLYYYTDAGEADIATYRKKLESAGYKFYAENEMADNLYVTYKSADGSEMVHMYYLKYENAVRIVTGAIDDDTVLPYNVDGAEKYTKITESKITQMTLDYASGNFGMCYIVTLEDGSFILFDGGGRAGGIDHVRLYNLLNKLNERPDGKIVIAAWILTHSHQDHYVVFSNFCNTYGSKVTIEQHISNVPDTTVRYNSGNPGGHMEDGTFDKAKESVGGFTCVKPYTGMKFWVRNAEIDVLYTHEALYPEKLRIFNNSTMVLRMTIGGQTVMWLGDIQNEGSNVICDMYGDMIKSDIVQVSHHGSTGATKELYKLVDPAVAFWPTSASNYKKQTAGTATSGAYVVDYYLAKQLNVIDIFVAQPDNISITLPFTPGSGKEITIDVPAG